MCIRLRRHVQRFGVCSEYWISCMACARYVICGPLLEINLLCEAKAHFQREATAHLGNRYSPEPSVSRCRVGPRKCPDFLGCTHYIARAPAPARHHHLHHHPNTNYHAVWDCWAQLGVFNLSPRLWSRYHHAVRCSARNIRKQSMGEGTGRKVQKT
jgi:hypothetical protein